jgi:hypothetical protein
MLLLLVCTIGVVTFFAFGLGFMSILEAPQVDDLLKEREERRMEAEWLKSRNQGLLNLLTEHQKPLPVSDSRQAMEQRYSTLEAERQDLSTRYDTLLENLVRLREEIESIRRSVPSEDTKEPTEPDFSSLDSELRKLRTERSRLKKEIEELEYKAKYGGGAGAEKVLHIEVQRDSCRFYPGGRTVALTQLTQGSYLDERIVGFDRVVFWIRPEGIETYYALLEETRTWKVSWSHEPLPEGQSVEMLLQRLLYER